MGEYGVCIRISKESIIKDGTSERGYGWDHGIRVTFPPG
jgi:hypothetical protein